MIVRRPHLALALALLSTGLAAAGGGGDSDDSTSANGPLVEAIKGEWSGTLHQAKTKPFPIRVRIDSADDPERNVVHYGGEIGCGGTWRYLGGDESSAQFRETIDRGAGGRCKGSGTVSLSRPEGSADSLDYRFEGGGVESRGVLDPAS